VNEGIWIWVSGSEKTNQRGIYGEQGNASTDNVPGARFSVTLWYDSTNQEAWVFGGRGYASTQSLGKCLFVCLFV